MRQTNVLWILFSIGIICLREYTKTNARVSTTKQQQEQQQKQPLSPSLPENELWMLWKFIQFLVCNLSHILSLTWSLWIPVIVFAVFIISYNHGNVVLGDQTNHIPTIHFALLAHTCTLSGLLLFPKWVFRSIYQWIFDDDDEDNGKKSENYIDHKRVQQRYQWWSIVGGFACSLALVYGSRSHPFLIADNRHYMFYIWQRYLQHASIR
jgi:alpha-1,2-glucosyltransferase